jgi:C2H2 transcription facotor
MVLHGTQPNMPGPNGINKRYRPAPAKTFQCRGYGECRMVFSRSEHLARHIRSAHFLFNTFSCPLSSCRLRKHTGERPFTCHCGKQFSRLDNLRQHAQTVHADKQEQNERMMRDLTSLHASMVAANKSTQPRGKRSQATTSSSAGSGSGSGSGSPGSTLPTPNTVKQEEDAQAAHQRPGTSTGYEGSDHTGILYQAPAWHVQTSEMDRPISRPTNNHSFRDPGQSFLAPSTTTTSSAQSQSFLSFPTTYNFSLSDHMRPGSSSSRPPTSGGSGPGESHPRSLPPLSSVVSSTIPSSSAQPQQQQQQPQLSSFSSSPHILPFPTFRRPSTANRPGTAPAYFGGPGLVHRSDLSFLPYGRDMAAPPSAQYSGSFDPDFSQSPSAAGSSYDSPFSFHPPALTDAQPATAHPLGSSPPNPRKRAFAGADGPESVAPDVYDYGTESRPQSRRLTVMELCNDTPAVLFPGHAGSRPGTSSGLVSSASALALIDRSPKVTYTSAGGGSPPLLARAAQAAAGTAATATGGSRGPETPVGGGGISARRVSSSTSASASAASAASTASVLSPAVRGSPALSDASAGFTPRASPYSPRSPAAHHTASNAARGIQSQSKSSSPATADAISRRGGNEPDHDQVRIAVSSPHSSATPVGMRV